MNISYRVQENIKCCWTCKYSCLYDDEYYPICEDTNEEVEFLGICDKWNQGVTGMCDE